MKPNTIIVYPLFFKIVRPDRYLKPIVNQLIQQHTHLKPFQSKYNQDKKYMYFYGESDDVYRFHRFVQIELLKLLHQSGLKENIHYTFIDKTRLKAKKIDLKHKPKYKPRDYQEPIIQFCKNNYPLNVIPIQTGKGKTLSSLFSACHLKHRTLIIVPAFLVDQWREGIKSFFDLDEDRFLDLTLPSRKIDIHALRWIEDPDRYDLVLMSLRSWLFYIKRYEEDPKSVPFEPDQITLKTGVGTVIMDEVHLEYEAQLKSILYTPVKKLIALSATIKSSDRLLDRYLKRTFPLKTHYTGLEYDRYIYLISVRYRLASLTGLKYTLKGRTEYNHPVYERWIMDDPEKRWNYLKMVDYYLKDGYMEHRDPGDKVLIYVSLVETGKIFEDYFKKHYPDLKVVRFMESEPKSVTKDADIIISSTKKAGVGQDIDRLICAILTVNILSISQNEQSLGRLRNYEEKYGKEKQVRFYYLWCEQIEKHLYYHQYKQKKLKDKVLKMKRVHYPFPI